MYIYTNVTKDETITIPNLGRLEPGESKEDERFFETHESKVKREEKEKSKSQEKRENIMRGTDKTSRSDENEGNKEESDKK